MTDKGHDHMTDMADREQTMVADKPGMSAPERIWAWVDPRAGLQGSLTRSYAPPDDVPHFYQPYVHADVAAKLLVAAVAAETDRCIEAVDDAGGDNAQYHIEAIRRQA